MRRIVVSGGTGLIGSALCRELCEGAYHVTVLTRSIERGRQQLAEPCVDYVAWEPHRPNEWPEAIEGAHAVVNLAGERIAGIWSRQKKQAILLSRLKSGRAITNAIITASQKPTLLVNASAVGYYGNRGDEVLDEDTTGGHGFLADVVRQWEESTLSVEHAGVRRVIIRTGLVLDSERGSLPLLSIPFRLFAGGPMGSGRQWMPWIHIDDEIRAIRYLIENEQWSGAFNLVSPNPVTNREFGRTLGRALRRPFWFPVPGALLKIVMGKMADELLLSGQRAIPQKLLSAGFRFRFPTLEGALRDILTT